jgi:hypothetical protein
MTSTTQKRLVAHEAIADQLLAIAGTGLSKKENKGYIVLERKLGKSESNKNAVSFIREGVSFMQSGWIAEEEAKSLHLHAERSKDFPRLIFPDLTLSQVRSNSDFFARLTQAAKLHAEYLQTNGAKSSSR